MEQESPLSIRFYEELNDFLPADKRKVSYDIKYLGKNSVKNVIEAEGVPHVEVDLILVNGESVGFDHHVKPGDRISVYPEFELLDITHHNRLRPEPLRDPRFIVDANLGRLVRYLRMLGFDTRFDINMDDDEIIRIALSEKRTILTRDLGILKNGAVQRGYFVRKQDPGDQISEVVNKFDLKTKFRPFTKCIACNGRIKEVHKEFIKDQIQKDTLQYFNEFFRCDNCGRIYWKGSHYERMLNKISMLSN